MVTLRIQLLTRVEMLQPCSGTESRTQCQGALSFALHSPHGVCLSWGFLLILWGI